MSERYFQRFIDDEWVTIDEEGRRIREKWKCSTYVYVIGTYPIEIGNHVKIGVAKSPSSRLQALQCGSPNELRVLGLLWDAGADTERYFHSKFSVYRVRGEWFELQDDLYWWVKELFHSTNWEDARGKVVIPTVEELAATTRQEAA